MKDESQGTFDATPDAGELFYGIGGNYDSIIQVICELIDNSWANIVSYNTENRNILITIDLEGKESRKFVKISIEDGGTGIVELTTALRVGDKSNQKSTLNEHGFGLIQALSAGNPENDNWSISTRTIKEFQKGTHRKIIAPYQYDVNHNTLFCDNSTWNGKFLGSGTIISFICSYEFFLSIDDVLYIEQKEFDVCLNYLVEKISHKYSDKFKSENVQVVIKSQNNEKIIPYEEIAQNIKPDWKQNGSYVKDISYEQFDGKNVLVKSEYGLINESKNLTVYKANMSTNGVEIRLNGRLFINNVFEEIWKKENHPDYNHFLGIVNIISEDKNSLPRTRTDKSNIRTGDKMLFELYQRIASNLKLPMKIKSNQAIEKELVDALIDKLIEKHKVKPSCIKREFYVFNSIEMPSRIDLYFINKQNSEIFEAKKSHAKKRHFYQLEEYWDGAVLDGLKLNTATLIVSKYDRQIYSLLKMFNSKLDASGNNYNFVMKTWNEFGINYKDYEKD